MVAFNLLAVVFNAGAWTSRPSRSWEGRDLNITRRCRFSSFIVWIGLMNVRKGNRWSYVGAEEANHMTHMAPRDNYLYRMWTAGTFTFCRHSERVDGWLPKYFRGVNCIKNGIFFSRYDSVRDYISGLPAYKNSCSCRCSVSPWRGYRGVTERL